MSAITQPTRVQPKNKLRIKMGTVLVLFRIIATPVGKRYKKLTNIITKPIHTLTNVNNVVVSFFISKSISTKKGVANKRRLPGSSFCYLQTFLFYRERTYYFLVDCFCLSYFFICCARLFIVISDNIVPIFFSDLLFT